MVRMENQRKLPKLILHPDHPNILLKFPSQ
jgi:hypothetical protein